MFSGFIWIFVAFFCFVVLIGVLGFLQAKRRREALQTWATSKGWVFERTDTSGLVGRFDGAPFGLGSSRRATNVVRGTYDGRSMLAYDYRYTTSSTNADGTSSSTTHVYSVLATELGVAFPELSVTPEGMIKRFFGRLTNTDIELESEDFNRAFTVNCSDRKFASDVLSPQMMELLLQQPEVAWRFNQGCLLVIRSGEHSIEELESKLAWMDAILDRVPAFVWQQWTGGSRA